MIHVRRVCMVASFLLGVSAMASSHGHKARAHSHAHEGVKPAPAYKTGFAPVHSEEGRAPASENNSKFSFKAEAEKVWTEFWAKVDELRALDQENTVLRKKIAELEFQNAELVHKTVFCHEYARANQIKKEAKREGGLETARTIASLEANKDLSALPPRSIYRAGLESFEGRDYESAAKSFILLVENHENQAYHTAQVFFLTGISLYQLGNFKSAQVYFEHAVEYAHKGGREPASTELSYAPRAMAWIAVCYSKLGDKAAERRTVQELIQRYPKSKEAQRLNRDA